MNLGSRGKKQNRKDDFEKRMILTVAQVREFIDYRLKVILIERSEKVNRKESELKKYGFALVKII